MHWNRELEPPMTLESAEILLAKARCWHPGKSDLAIARLIHENSGNSIISYFVMTPVFMHGWEEHPWMLWLLLPLLGLVIQAAITRSRFSRIRRLFEERAPQYLAEFSDHPVSSDRLPPPGSITP